MTEQNSADEITLKELIQRLTEWFRYFKTKWKIIFLGGFVGTCIGFAVAYFDKPIYTAELTFALEDKSTGGGGYASIASQFGIDIGGSGGGAFSGENNIELMKSRTLIEQTLLSSIFIDGKEQLLVNRYIEFNKLRDSWKNKPELANIVFTADEPREKYTIAKDSILKAIYQTIKKKNLTIEKIDKKLTIIYVRYKGEDELFAKFFTERLVSVASEFYIKTKTKKSKRNLDILEARIDSVKRELDSEIYGAAISKDQNNNVIRARGNVQSAKKQLNVQILTTMYGELIKNAEVAKFTLMREEPLIQIIDTPVLPLDKSKLGKIMSGLIGCILSGLVMILILLVNKMRIDITG